MCNFQFGCTVLTKKFGMHKHHPYPNLKLLFCALLITITPVLADGQGWMWANGNSSSPNGFGQAGIANPLNTPGQSYARNTWTDLDGNLWTYGGGHTSPASTNSVGSDLWKYDIITNQWSFISGDFTSITAVMGVPGPQGVPTNGSTPGPSGLGQPRWIDNNGDLWLGGGGSLSDVMWRFDQTSQNWSWMSGLITQQQTVNYGVQGVPNSTNSPGRFFGEDNLNWKDENGNFWYYNLVDGVVWRYNPNTLLWTWMLGTPMSGPVYGTIGQAASTNTPGVLTASASYGWMTWQDSSYNCYIGYGRVNFPNIDYELWRLDITNLTWNCLYQFSLDVNNAHQYSTNTCNSGSNDRPIWGKEQRVTWVDDCGNMWTVQPNKNIVNSATEVGLWRYESDSETFTLVDTYSNRVFGTMGVRSPLNHPFHTTNGASSWVSDGKFWTMEGVNAGNTVLWNYEPDLVNADFDTTVSCTQVAFSDLSSTGCNRIKSWEWDFGDGTKSTDQNPTHTYSANGTYSVQLIVQNCTWDADTIVKTITTNACGFHGVYSVDSDSICGGDCTNINLNANGGTPPYSFEIQPGTTTNSSLFRICPDTSTTYTIIASDANGATDTSTLFVYVNPLLVTFNASTISGAAPLNVDFTNLSIGADGYYWKIDGQIFSVFDTTYQFDEGSHQAVLVGFNDACIDSFTVEINVGVQSIIIVPNIFTPNGDGVNDAFTISHSNIETFEIQIFNRWGSQIFTSSNIDESWKGLVKDDKPASDGVYFYIIKAIGYDGKAHHLKGYVTVVN